jgi:hypothetical protein
VLENNMKRSFVAFTVALLLAASAYSQESRSTISGSVSDAAAAVLPSVKVTATETRTNTKTQAVTDASGQFVLPFLSPGDYTLAVEVTGFKKYQQTHLVLNAGDHPIVDIRLEVGDVAQNVAVVADVPLLGTADASSGLVVTDAQVESLPLNGRTPFNLTFSTMGVMPTAAAWGGFHAYDNSAGAAFTIAGLANKTNEMLTDGAPDNASDNSPAYSPPEDAVQEVRVFTFESDAAYGHTGAGVANQITKSGTNGLHGSAWEFNQTSALASNSWINDKNGVKNPVGRQNQWGASAGGPILLPKVFNGKNKVFWFFAYEGLANNYPGGTYTTVPTAAERTGDFSALLAAGASYQIYNPFSAAENSSGVVTRSPFPNNVIPTSLLSPIALAYLKFYPQPNATTLRSSGVNDGFDNYYDLVASEDHFNNEFGRLDFNISNSNRLFFSFRHNDRLEHFNDYFGNVSTGDRLNRMNWGSTIDDVETISPTTVANVRLNFTRFIQNQNLAGYGTDATSLGFPSYIAADAQYPMLPVIEFQGNGSACQTPSTSQSNSFQCLGWSNNTPSLAPFNSYGLFGDVVKVHGNHTWKFGVDVRDFRKSYTTLLNATGQFNFDDTWVKQSSTSTTNQPLGGDMAAFLLGLPTSGSYNVNAQFTARNAYLGAFFQDDWRVRPDLTLNFGVRYEKDFNGTEDFNRAVNGFASSTPSPIAGAAETAYAASPNALLPASQFQVNGGLTFANPSQPYIYKEISNLDFSPRIGYAWTPKKFKNKTVFRGGLGVFVLPIIPWNNAVNQEGFSQTSQLTATNNNYLSPLATLANPFPSGILQPSGSSLGLSTFLGQSLTLFNPTYQNGYSERWEFGVQHELPAAILFEADYVGNHAVRLSITRNLDWVERQYETAASNASLSGSVVNPFAGLLPNSTSLNGSKISLAQLLSTYPEFPTGGISEQNTQGGGSYFNALDVKLEKRPAHGVTLLVNYQFSKLIEHIDYLNDSDLAPEKRISSLDHTHHAVAAVTIELPFGHGRKFQFGGSRALDLVAGGWIWNSIYSYQTGAPLAWGNVIYLGSALNLNARQTLGPAFNTAAFDRVSADQPVYNLRTFNTQFGNLRADAINNWDSSFTKNFRFTEGRYLQLRLEAFNAFNHPQFSTPNLTPTSSAFGLITATANSSRLVQLGARMVF